jgi:hypothetical protein
VPAVLLGEFSSRAADIRRRMHEHGGRSARGARIAWAATRPEKVAAPPYDELAREWMARARNAGVAPGELEAGLGVSAPVRPALDEHAVAGVLSLTPHGGAHRRDVVTAFGEGAPAGARAPVLDRLVDDWVPDGPGAAVGVAEPLHRRADVSPGSHLLRALGPRPVHPDDHAVWRDAAREVDAYRERWGVGAAPEPLGIPDGPAGLASVSTARLADHVHTAARLDAARVRLGVRRPPVMEIGLTR